MKKHVLLSAAALAVLASGSASALDLTDSMNVTAMVTAACTSLTASDLNFGTHGAADTTTDATATVTVTCDNGTFYTVGIDSGITGGGAFGRQVTDVNGEFMDYEIFQPGAGGGSATTAAWGEGLDAYDGTGSGVAQALTATGRMHWTSGRSPGTYTDLVTVTLTF
jgi:spore coat protein U-like protein